MMFNSIRNWLIRLIVGNKPVIMNVEITSQGVVIPQGFALIANNQIKPKTT